MACHRRRLCKTAMSCCAQVRPLARLCRVVWWTRHAGCVWWCPKFRACLRHCTSELATPCRQWVDSLPRCSAGKGPSPSATLCHSDDELEFFPGLAHVLASPSPSGTCSPQLPAAAALLAAPMAPGLDATAAAQRLSGPVPPGEAATAAAERLSVPAFQGFAAAAEDQAGGQQAAEQGATVHARRAGTPEGDGYDAAALVQAVEFHLTMFPSLKAEVGSV